jgi:hypothetical protein
MINAEQAQPLLPPLLPEEIVWKPFPAFPPTARLGVVVGDPASPGPYVGRVKVPAGGRRRPAGGTAHFHQAKSGEYITQVTATGPISLDYVDPSDDPRSTARGQSAR